MAEPAPIRVEGLAELTRAFTALDRNLGRGIREAVENAAEPVRQEATSLVRNNVSGMARSRVPWWSMRVGSLSYGSYIAPQQRGVKGRPDDRRRRPNLKEQMRPQMEQALENNRSRIEEAVLDEIDELSRAWERV